jgi:antitoxin component YwqK of YwqJK toxin-antitoxin module
MKYTFAILSFFCFSLTSSAQSDTLIRFFDYFYREVPEKGSVYSSLTIIQKMDDGNIMVQDFYLKIGKIMRRSYFSDSLLQIKTGPYEVFHENGSRKVKGNFTKNKPTSVWKEWDNEGHLLDSVFYNLEGNMTGTRIQKYPNGSISDSSVYAVDGSGRGETYEFYGTNEIRGRGVKINDQKNGLWKYYQKSGAISAEETYALDSLLSIRCFDEKGDIISKDCVAEIDADFPGGIKEWTALLTKKIYASRKELKKNGGHGTTIIIFIINTDGTISDVKAETKSNTHLDEVVMRIIREAPRWIPARQHNILVRAYRKQPITYEEE